MLNRMAKPDILTALKDASAALTASASPRLDAEILLAHCLHLQRVDLYRNPERVLTDEEVDAFRRTLARRKSGEPIAYIIGRKEFWSMTFTVDRRVLIPRPDTEILVEEAIRICGEYGCRTLLEIGTGSGAISVALAATLPDLEITATDLSPGALILARENAAANGVAERIRFLHGDLFEPVKEKHFDVIVSNPPYIAEDDYQRLPEGVRCFEPALALLARPFGSAFHRRIIEGGGELLTPRGWILMECGEGQAQRISDIFHENQFGDCCIIKDYSGLDRVVEARKD